MNNYSLDDLNMSIDLDYDNLYDIPLDDDSWTTIIRDASSAGVATQAGIQSNCLQSIIDNFPTAMNQAAVAKSTGMPVKIPSQQYKGFAAEEYFKNTLKINAVSQGCLDYKLRV